MEIHFDNTYLEKLYAGLPMSGKPKYNEDVVEKFRKRIVLLENIESSNELRNFRGLNFEALKGDKKGLYSIRVDLKYRLEFSIEKNRIMLHEIILIKNLSNHYR
jgi:toxin HigB-1